MPPTPSKGSTATASTMIPMPPIQCRLQRHRLMDCGRASRPLSTVEPVVVSPDIVSKYASVKLRPGIAIIREWLPEADINTHEATPA
jgi:hypothetical protein